MNFKLKLAFLFSLLSLSVQAQTIQDFYLYSYDHALFNPAAAGSEEKHIFGVNGRISLQNFDYKKTSPLSAIVSYNGNINPIKSGVGILAVVDYIGAQKISKVALSYNYRFKINNSSSFRLGIRPTITKATIDFDAYRFADESDPLNKVGKKSEREVDLDVGGWLKIGQFYSGVSVNNLLNHSFDFQTDSLRTTDWLGHQSITIIAGKKIKWKKVEVDPSVGFLKQNKYRFLNLSSNFSFRNLIVVGGTFIQDLDFVGSNFTLNGGFKIKNTFEIIGTFYSAKHHPNIDDQRFFEGQIRVKI
jgi:type IX secretion system PorP/SprF family membrane protein